MTLLTSEPSGDYVADGQYEPAQDNSSNELALGLQLMRASSITSNRLQLALARRDRRAAMTALDTLAAVDAEVEMLVDRLSGRGAATPELTAIGAWLADEKKAASAERLNLACDFSGPGLVSASAQSSEPGEGRHEAGDRSTDEAASAAGSTGADTARTASARRWWTLVLIAVAVVLAAGLITAFALPPDTLPANLAEFDRLIGLR